jgi:hypothetical protein
MRLLLAVVALFASGSAAAQTDEEWEKNWRGCPRRVELESGKDTVVESPAPVSRIVLNGSDVAAYEPLGARKIRITAYQPGYDFLRAWTDDGRFEVCIKVTRPSGKPEPEKPSPTGSPGRCEREGRALSVATMTMKPGEGVRYFMPGWQTFGVEKNPDVVGVAGAGANYLQVTARALGTATVRLCSEKDFRQLTVFVTAEGSPGPPSRPDR